MNHLPRIPVFMVRLTIAMITMIAATGCVRRTMTINTKPEGATVLLNDEMVGTTPVSTDFLWPGDYDIIVRKQGYETLKTHQRIKAAWYDLPGIDFFSELLLPVELHDKHEVCFELETSKTISHEDLLKDAKAMRDETLYGGDERPTTRPENMPQ